MTALPSCSSLGNKEEFQHNPHTAESGRVGREGGRGTHPAKRILLNEISWIPWGNAGDVCAALLLLGVNTEHPQEPVCPCAGRNQQQAEPSRVGSSWQCCSSAVETHFCIVVLHWVFLDQNSAWLHLDRAVWEQWCSPAIPI